MEFLTLDGRRKNIYLNEYKIHWGKPSISQFQTRVKNFLHENFGSLFWAEELPLVGELSQLRVDFFCKYEDLWGNTKRLIIEADGSFHTQMNKFFFKTEEEFLQSLERDSVKELYCDINDIPLLRIHPEHEPLNINEFNERFNYPLALARNLL